MRGVRSWISGFVLAALGGMAGVGTFQSGTHQQKVRTFHTAEEFQTLTGGTVRLERQLDPRARDALRGIVLPVALDQVTVVAPDSASATWIGTRQGAIRLAADRRTREYFAGGRWLPDHNVTGIGFEGAAVWLETPKGLARITYTPMTLEEKARHFLDRIQRRHVRWGLTADSQLRVPGDLSTSRPISTDNDGLWTAMYVAAESFRYKVTGAADARDNARRGMQAMMRLESITGIPGFPARSFIKVGEDVQPEDGEWHDAAEKGWRWKGDTSSDEIVGHYFVYPLYYELVATEEERPALRGAIDRITNHIIDNGYQLIDVDGQRTQWGWWAPELIWEDADETGLRALHLVSHLTVALHVTANPDYRAKYQAAYDSLVSTHKYHLLTRNQKIMVPGRINHSDDELAFLSFYPLLRYSRDKARIDVYKESLERSWQIERPERNPLWNFIYAAGTGAKEFDRAESIRTLQEIPMDLVEWAVRNSHRLDVPIDSLADRFKRRQSLVVLPYDELPMSKWNGNPYRLDAPGEGRTEDDGAYYLLPYWMGRFHRLIER